MGKPWEGDEWKALESIGMVLLDVIGGDRLKESLVRIRWYDEDTRGEMQTRTVDRDGMCNLLLVLSEN